MLVGILTKKFGNRGKAVVKRVELAEPSEHLFEIIPSNFTAMKQTCRIVVLVDKCLLQVGKLVLIDVVVATEQNEYI